MGMNAELVATGKFSKDLVELMDYPEDYYEDTKEGAMVMTTVLLCGTTTESKALASALGFDAWDFNEHFIGTLSEDQLAALRVLLDAYNVSFPVGAWRMIGNLNRAGFEFWYLPHG